MAPALEGAEIGGQGSKTMEGIRMEGVPLGQAENVAWISMVLRRLFGGRQDDPLGRDSPPVVSAIGIWHCPLFLEGGEGILSLRGLWADPLNASRTGADAHRLRSRIFALSAMMCGLNDRRVVTECRADE